MDKCDKKLDLCEVGAHHQNGIAENYIKTISLSTRTLLIHAKQRLPEAHSIILWPFAILAAIEKENFIKMKKNGLTPAEEFGGIDRSTIGAENFHTWGCPVYVLDAKLQSGSIGPPKWESRGRVGIYLGHSPFHTGNVALVFSLQTVMYHLSIM